MKSVMMLVIGLVCAVLICGVVLVIIMRNEQGIISRQETEIANLRKSINALAARLLDSQEAQAQLQSRLLALHNQSGQTKEPLPLSPAALKDANPANKKPPIKADNMRRYAQAILRAYSAHEKGKEDDLENDQMLQATFMELMAEMTRLMAQNNIAFDTRRFAGDEIFKAYAVPEIRQWYCQLGAAIFEELGLPLTESQISAVDSAMLASSERYKNIVNPEFTRLESAIALSKFQSEQSSEFARIFTDEQNKKLPQEVADTMIGREDRRSGLHSRIDTNPKTISDCAGVVLQQWTRNLELAETEKQGVKYLAEMYVNEQSTLKTASEAEYGKEFMDFYLQRYDRSNKDNTANWWNAQNAFFENPDNKAKRDALNLRFAELQVKYQRQLLNVLPNKAERIKNQAPIVTIFSYLGN